MLISCLSSNKAASANEVDTRYKRDFTLMGDAEDTMDCKYEQRRSLNYDDTYLKSECDS